MLTIYLVLDCTELVGTRYITHLEHSTTNYVLEVRWAFLHIAKSRISLVCL